jgi:hypothetical protein
MILSYTIHVSFNNCEVIFKKTNNTTMLKLITLNILQQMLGKVEKIFKNLKETLYNK